MLLSRALPALLFVMASVAAAATPDREQELARATAQRDELVAERTRLAAAARAAADRLAATGAPAARAGSALSRQLREFDRLAHGLDDVERRLAEQERRRVRARAAFDAAADGEERRLEERARREGAAAVAAEMAALAAARRRVAQSETSGAFRPPLEVALDPLDGPADVEAKLAILQSEEARVAAPRGAGGRGVAPRDPGGGAAGMGARARRRAARCGGSDRPPGSRRRGRARLAARTRRAWRGDRARA